MAKLWLYNTKIILHWPCCTKKAEDFWIFIILVLEQKNILWNTKIRKSFGLWLAIIIYCVCIYLLIFAWKIISKQWQCLGLFLTCWKTSFMLQQVIFHPVRLCGFYLYTNSHLLTLPRSSKCVSMPFGPATEQMRRVFRKELHLFTSILCPPWSFWRVDAHIKCECSTQALVGSCPEFLLWQHYHSHRTDSANTSIHSLLHSFRIRLQLSEEEIHLIIIPVIIVRNNNWSHKFWFWWTKICNNDKKRH